MGNVVYYIKKSMVFPKWSVKLFWSLLTIIFLVLGFSAYKVSRTAQIRQEGYGQGEEKAVVHFRAFFRANPEAAELYQNWKEHQSKK